MSSIQVAPIYSDPWAKTNFEGMAKLVSETIDEPEKTLLGVTCKLWCVRFFYTEVGLKRWVETSAIETWQDTLDWKLSFSTCSNTAWLQKARTSARKQCLQAAGVGETGYIDAQYVANDHQIIGIGFQYSIDLLAHADSYVEMTLYNQDDEDPTAAQVTLKYLAGTTQSDTYIARYGALGSPHEIESIDSLSVRMGIFAKKDGAPEPYIWVKSPFIRFERSL